MNTIYDIDIHSKSCCQRCISGSKDRSTRVGPHHKREEYALFQILMSVPMVNTSVIRCVTMSLAGTYALVEGHIYSHLIKKHVKVRTNESIYLLLLTEAPST